MKREDNMNKDKSYDITVGQLIESLKKLDPDRKVFFEILLRSHSFIENISYSHINDDDSFEYCTIVLSGKLIYHTDEDEGTYDDYNPMC